MEPEQNTVNPAAAKTAGRTPRRTKAEQGNATANRTQEYRAAILDAYDAKTLEQVLHKLGELAIKGDLTAIKIYLEYTCVKPNQALELQSPEGEAPASIDPKQAFDAIFSALRPFPGEVRAAIAAQIGALSTDVPANG